MYLSKYPKRRWTKKPQKSLGRVVRVHSRSARPLPLSQCRDLLTLTKWFPPLKSNFLSPFEPSPLVPSSFGSTRRYLLRGNFSRRWTRVSLTPSPSSRWLANVKIDYQPSVRVSSLRVETARSQRRSFPLRFSRALEQKWIVHDVFNTRPRPTEIRRTSLRGKRVNLFLTGQFFLLNRAKLALSSTDLKGIIPSFLGVKRVVIVPMNCPRARRLEVRW